jgi:hypothetical protein
MSSSCGPDSVAVDRVNHQCRSVHYRQSGETCIAKAYELLSFGDPRRGPDRMTPLCQVLGIPLRRALMALRRIMGKPECRNSDGIPALVRIDRRNWAREYF